MEAVTREVVRSPVSLLQQDWPFVPSNPSLQIRRLRVQKRWMARHPAPPFTVLRPPAPRDRWNLLFLFAPAGRLDWDQQEMLARLRALRGGLLVVCAAPAAADLPDLSVADAVAWKGVAGFDFSAYALGLRLIAEHSPGATTYVQNDSVYGPLTDIDEQVARAHWDLTGFVASATVENHVSSFAFVLRNVTPARVEALSPVLPVDWCYNDFSSVVVAQETMLARVASACMSVGSFLYMPVRPATPSWKQRIVLRLWADAALRYPLDVSGDPTLGSPLELLDLGFPFLKRSLLGKFPGLEDAGTLRARLNGLGWPI